MRFTRLLLCWAALTACGDDDPSQAGVDGRADTTVAADTSADGDAALPADTTPAPDPTEALFDGGRVLEVAIELPSGSWDALRTQTRTLFDILGPGCLDAPVERPFTWFAGSA